MAKQRALMILGIIAIMCILFSLIGLDNSGMALILGIFIIIGLFVYLFLGREGSGSTN